MKYFVVDVFTDEIFSGNPAGVCLLDEWPPDETLQNIAMENNLSETAYLVKHDSYYDLRWFTPALEVDLCGHATMGSAFVLFNVVKTGEKALEFHTLSGVLTVKQENGMIWMDFPSRPSVPAPMFENVSKSLNIRQYEIYKAADLLVVIDSEDAVRNLDPDLEPLGKKLKEEAGMPDDNFGVIVTAPGSDCDFVSRYFAPSCGINEDPVTGSTHCMMIPYWSQRLGLKNMTARQLSKRGGRLWCVDAGDRVMIGGKAALYMSGEIIV
ncbi:MAG: PhzF family phenazine biosynthesis protein [Oscillospiraceae bacterium]|jgi:PhzF family phenazine biosynthesis protein|nr:PhzF family phenazine biosynthesis protein [Oscillospiraceae bacterium]